MALTLLIVLFLALNPVALRKAKIVYHFGLRVCRVKVLIPSEEYAVFFTSRFLCSVFQAALHIHCSSNQDDLLHQAQSNRNSHPLDSSLTCDVLR